MRPARFVLAVAACLLLAPVLPACGEDPLPLLGADAASLFEPDVGDSADSGSTEADAGAAPDASADPADAGSTPADAGADPADAGTEADAAAEADASLPADAAVGAPDASTPALDGGTRIRLMAANITTGTKQSYDPGHGIRIFQGLKPDVTMLQEFNYGDKSESAIRGFVDTAFGPEFVYYRESQAGDTIPNGIISRYPILESGEWDDPASINRDVAWARLDVPGPRDLWVVSVHLRTSNATDRNTGAQVAVTHLKQVVPAGDLLVLGGDFNTGSRTEPCIATLSELLVTSAPYPADQLGNTLTSAKRSAPLDWLLVSPALDSLEVPVAIGANRFADGLVFDSRVYTPIGDVAPVLATDSGASGMQHMALVRDFLLP